MRRFYKHRIITEDQDCLLKFESSWADYRLLLQTATDGVTSTNKAAIWKVYTRGTEIKAR